MNIENSVPIKNEDEIEFVVFCIENLALKHGKDGSYVYKSLKDRSNILNSYIVPGYGFLHTQDKDYILEDIEEIMQEQGVSI